MKTLLFSSVTTHCVISIVDVNTIKQTLVVSRTYWDVLMLT